MPFDEPTPPGYKLRQLQERADATDKRLEKGADAFAAMRSRTTWFALGLVTTILAGAIAVGRILQRIDDTTSNQGQHETKLESVREDVAAIEREQIRVRGAVERVEEGQTRIETTLGRIVADPLGRRRSR